MVSALWGLVGVFVSAQALVYAALLIWPGGVDLRAVVTRFETWQGSGMLILQIFFALPLLSALIWRMRVQRQAQVLVGLCFLCTALLAASGWLELSQIESAIRESVNAQDRLRGLALLRWGEFALAMMAAIVLRLGWSARRL